MVCFVVTQHSESELSLCLRYSKTSSRQATKIIRVDPRNPCDRLNSDDEYISCRQATKNFRDFRDFRVTLKKERTWRDKKIRENPLSMLKSKYFDHYF